MLHIIANLVLIVNTILSYLRGVCGVHRWDGASNECVYERAWKWGTVGCGGMGEKEHSEMVWPY